MATPTDRPLRLAGGVLARPLAFITVAPIIALVPEALVLAAVSWMALTLLSDEANSSRVVGSR